MEKDFATPSRDAGPSMATGSGAADSALPEEKQPPKPPGQHAVSVLWSFGKCLATLLPVYLAGYFGFSITLVLFGLMVYMGWTHSRNEKVMRLRSAMYVLENERAYATARAFRSKRELPPWVNFPDVEKVEWMNKVCSQAWPFVGQYLEKLLVETIAPVIRASNTHLQTLSFTKVNLGDKALKVVGVKAHTEHDKRQVLLDLYISYAGDVEINVEIKKYFCKAGVKGVQLHGMLRVILEPLIGDVPLVGAVTMFFIRRPKLDINWTGLTNLLDIPGLNAMSDTKIMDAIASYLVLPNRLTIPLVADLHVAQLRSPLPRGVVRIHLLEAEELTAKDTVIKGIIDGKSDPYAVLRVGTQTFTSHTVDSNLNPQWREMYEVIVHEVPGQELEVEVFDKDQNQDDFLGRVKMDLDIVHKARVLDEWFSLKDVPSGSVHLRLEWLSLLSSTHTTVVEYQPLSTLIHLSIISTHLFTSSSASPPPPPPSSFSPPLSSSSSLQVKDDDRALSLGSLSIPLSRLLASPDLSMDQWFQLDNSGQASRIYINAVLRVGGEHAHKCRKARTGSTAHTQKTHTVLLQQGDQIKILHLYGASEHCAVQCPHAVSHPVCSLFAFRGLPACGSAKDGSDPYVSFILLPDKNRITKRKTITKKRDLNPEFNERFDFDFSLEESMQRRLDLTVKNNVSFMSRERELIGKVSYCRLSNDLCPGL
uniref:Extended synaptotagmin-like protein 1a n=1 Tax=Oncorhynchus tshawytscha TaxID=74940 RepID=A0AAZ3R7Y5_ONCTS